MAQAFNLTARINMAGPYNLRPVISKIKKDIGAIKPELKFKLDPNAVNSVKKVTAEIKKLDSATKSAQKSVGGLNNQLLSLASSFNNAAAASKNASNAAANVSKATANAAKSATQARTAIEEFGKQSGLAIKRFAAFSSVTSVIYGVTNAITDAYKEFLVFNKEIVRLSQVTDKSLTELKGISNEITRLSTTIGVASSDLITVASTLAQAGLSAQDTKIALEALAKSALAPSFENIIDTTEGAIAAIRQFGLETSQLEGALGSINAVAAAFAVEAGDIIAAIQRTGGVFASASRGVSEGTDALNEFIAIFTSVRQTTRESAETIATGLRTIFTRIQRSSTIDLLKQYGVELRDLEGKFVGPYEAVRRLSDGLNRIDPRSADFARISEELGGFRQIGKVIPLIQQFAVAQDALNVAQKGSGSLSRDVQTAQQSLAVQFAKTRENFLALVREVADSTSFKTIVNSTLFLTNALVDLGRALKPLLPLLLTFGAIKVGAGINQFIGGFGLAFNRGGGSTGGGPTGGGGGGGPTGGGPGGNQPLTSALSLNTAATNAINQTLATLNTSILALNQNIVNTNSLLLNRPTRGFNVGGLVPGSGNRDTVRANLTPGEFVLRKQAVEAVGVDNLMQMNHGGIVQKFADGAEVEEINTISQILSDIFKDKFITDPKTNTGKIRVKPTTIKRGEYKGKSIERTITASDILSSKSLENLATSTGLNLSDLTLAQQQLKARSEGQKLANAALQEQIIKNKQEATKAGKVIPFGLVGLRYGSGAKGQSSLGTFPVDVPPAFSDTDYQNVRGINVGTETAAKQQFIKIITNTVSSSLGQDYAQQFQNVIYKGFETGVINGAKVLASKSATLGASINTNPDDIQKFIENAGFYNVIGAGLESSLNLLGAPFTPKDENTKSIDFPTGLGPAAEIFGGIFKDIPTDITRTIGPGGKDASKYIEQIERYFKTQAGSEKLTKFAWGGAASGKDTVKALLTPGEFVFSKEAAERVGYGTLNRLNKADKVQGFNKGGVVGYANGGAVATDPAVIGAALASVLLPQVQKLADTFGKLEGTAGEFGTVLGGAIREASSTILSSTIALQAVGASQGTIRAAQIGGGLTSAIAGGMTDSSAKALEKALLSNTAAINKFETNLQDIANAPTEELRAEASARLEKSFIALDNSVRNSKDNIDRLENLKNFGDTMQSINTIVLTTITAITALKAASTQAASAVAASKAPGAFVTGAAFVPTTTKLLATFGSWIPVIGSLVGIISTGIEVWGFFNNRLKSSNEQFDRLNKALDETVKNSNAYNLGNKNFVENILPQFQQIVDTARGADNPQESIRNQLARLPNTSALDLRFRQRLIPRAQEIGVGISPNETVADIQNKLMGTNLEVAFQKIIKELEDAAMKADAVSYLIEKEGLDRAEAEKKVNDLVKNDQNELRRLSSTYNAAKNQEILASRLIADAANRVQTSLVNLDNILTRTSALYEKSLTALTNKFEDLNSQSNLLLGKPNIDLSRIPSRDIETLQNLMGSSNEEVVNIMSKFTQSANLPGKLGKELTDQVVAAQTLEKDMGIVLNTLAEKGQAGNLDQLLKDTLGKSLEASIGTGTEAKKTIDIILKEVGTNLNAALAKGDAPRTLKELASTNKTLDATFQSGQRSIKFVIDSLNIYAKGLKALSEEQKQTIELENQIRQKTLQRIETEKKASIQFREIFDVEVPLSDRLDVFNAGIRQQTAGIGQLPAAGTTNVAAINAERQRIRANIQRLQTDNENNRLTGKQSEELRRNISELEVLTSVIEKIADGGEQVNLVFEAIAKQRDQFKTQREVLIDILKKSRDPAQQLQLRAEFESIQAVLSGRFSETQGFRALESSLLRIFSASQQETITQNILQGLGAGARPSTPAETGAINRVLAWLTTGGLTAQLASILSGTMGNIRAATNIQTNELEKARNNRIQENIKAIDNWTKSIQTSAQLAGVLIEEKRPTVQGQPTPKVTSKQDIATLSALLQAMTKMGPSVIPYSSSATGAARERLADERRLRIFPEDERMKNLRTRLSEKQAQGATFGGKEGLGVEILRFLAQTKVDPQFAPLVNDFTKRVSDLIRSSNEQQRKTQNQIPSSFNPRAQPIPSASLDPRATERFSTSATQLASALTGDNTNITQLSSAVNSLTPVTNDLKNAVNQLSALFKDGKIQVAQETKGEVNVNFNNSLPIERDANADTRFLEQISTMAQNTISEQLRSFIRQYS